MDEPAMDEREFRRLLDMFPVVRSRDYAEQEPAERSTSRSPRDEVSEWKDAWNNMVDDSDSFAGATSKVVTDPFWEKLRLAAEKKVGQAQAKQFCQALQRAHEKLVYKELTLESARKFIEHT